MKTNSNYKKEKSQDTKNDALNEARAVAPKYCEKCGFEYSDDNFQLVQKNNNQAVFHLKCSKCGNTYILNVVSPSPNIMASQRSSLNIDLTEPDEMSKFAGKGAVSKDEALDIFNILKDTDIESLLK